MVKKTKIRKRMGFLLSLTMVASVGMAVGQNPVDVMAQENAPSSTTEEIDQSLFATKNELKNVFSVDNREGEIVGKIVFGTDVEDNNSGQIWYIVGSETNRASDNINLFAVDNIGGDVVWGRGEDVVDWDTNDYSDYNYPVTYAGSTLNDTMDAIAMDEDYFTLAEQSLMNDTVVKLILYSVNDGWLNEGNYNITSKLYPVESDIDFVVDSGYDDYTGLYSDDLKVSLGTDNGYNVDIKKYVWGQGEPFFLRDSYKYPYNGYEYSLRVKPAYFDTNATESDLDDLLAKKEVNINTSNYEYDTVTSGVRPAFNLNITNVLFASAVPTKNGAGYNIEDDAAMELRFDGSSMDLGNVVLDEDGLILVTPGTATDSVRLVVQGKDSEAGNWYYTKEIDEETVVKASDIIRATGAQSALDNIDNEYIQVWIEASIDNNSEGALTYAKFAVEGNVELPERTDYEIIGEDDNEGNEWKKGSNKYLKIKTNGNIVNFEGIKVDAVFINENNYEVEDDDTVENDMVVKIKSSYLEELPTGEHEIELVWDDGIVSMVIAIEDANQGGEDPNQSGEEVPETGDNINIIQPLMILIVTALVTVVLLSTKRKKA